MSDRFFLDTNIFVYSFDRGAAAIQAQCEVLMPKIFSTVSSSVTCG